MKLAIVGAGRSGKDTAAEYLRDNYGLRYTHGTSQWAAKIVWAYMTRTGHGYDTPQEAWEDRHAHRELWAKVIGDYNKADPTRLYRSCIANQDILTGLRWCSEFYACVNARLFDVSLWIERPGICFDPTCEIIASDCDYEICNDGPLDLFYTRLDRFAASLGLSKATSTCA
jgi:hypothetical protein